MKLKTNTGLIIIIAAAILMQGILAVQYYYTRSLLVDELEKRAESEITTKAVIVKNTLNLAENSLNGHLWDLKRNLLHPDSTYNVMELVLKSHPNLTGCWVAYVPNFFPEKGRLFEPFVWWDHGEIKHAEVAAEGRDYTENRYYKAVYASDIPMWTDLYEDIVSGLNLVTYILPIHDSKGDIVAMFGLDMSTEQLGDTLNYRHIYPSSYNFLLTEKGQLLAGPRHMQEKKVAEMEHIISQINDSTVEKSLSNSGRSKVFRIQDADGDEGMVLYAPFKGQPKWQIAVVCYDKEVFAKLLKMRRTIGILMLLGLLVLGLIIARFAKNDRNLQKAKMEQERIGSELRIARNIQMQMLPKVSMPCSDRQDIDIFGSLYPAKEVGGDLYDFFLRDEKLFFCIGDVSGKGVPSAMLMAVVHSLFRSASVHETNPSRIMQHLNEMSCEGNESNMFVTLFLGVLDLPTGHLRYCNAGHDKPLLVGDTVMELPAKANLPIGLFTDIRYEIQEYQLEPMTTIFLYTDGLTEAKNNLHKLFGQARVKETLSSGKTLTPQALVEQMKEEVHRFMEDAQQSDDLTMLAIRYTPKQQEEVLSETLTLKNNPRQISLLSSFVKDVLGRLFKETGREGEKDTERLAKEIRLGVEEAVVNVIDYAYPAGTEGDITVYVSSDGQEVKFVISDTGIPFDPTEVDQTDTTLSIDERPVGGLGIHLVRQLMDSINYERMNGKNVLTLKKKYDGNKN
ncbi:MAG: SpoIIE family protein phosphatase [Prevotella sp.]|nr:SpoIIE family protein phosphatase [Prevotella sp.]